MRSFSIRLSFRFMLLLTVAVLALSMTFVGLIHQIIRSGQTDELNMAVELISKMIRNNDESEIEKMPYYVTYTIYDRETREVIDTNDPYLPLLENTDGESRMHFVKDYFIDGDLNILYVAKNYQLEEKNYIIQASLNMDMDTTNRIFIELPKAIAVAVLPILFISFLVSFFITKNTIRPVVKITRTAEQISSSNLDQLLPIGRHNDEIDQLAETFNMLFKRLKADFDQERQFTSDVSHELKTPVAVIGGQANMLLRWGKDDPVQLEKSLVTIKNEAKSMQAIIENLLQISRIENGRIQPQLVRVSLDEMFNRLKIEIEAFAPGVKIECSGKGLNIDTDEELFHQVMTVMMQNSVKFTGEGCVIKLNAFAEDRRVKVTVEDNGPGIDEKALPHIFERFYRGDEAHTRTAGGSGLGLSIAKTIVEALGGKIGAQNRPEGGALLWIKF